MNCHGCGRKFDFNDCITNPGNQVEPGSVGMCYVCGCWWQMGPTGSAMPYTPTAAEMKLVTENLLKSRERFRLEWQKAFPGRDFDKWERRHG